MKNQTENQNQTNSNQTKESEKKMKNTNEKLQEKKIIKKVIWIIKDWKNPASVEVVKDDIDKIQFDKWASRNGEQITMPEYIKTVNKLKTDQNLVFPSFTSMRCFGINYPRHIKKQNADKLSPLEQKELIDLSNTYFNLALTLKDYQTPEQKTIVKSIINQRNKCLSI